jgi:hypothetical protein
MVHEALMYKEALSRFGDNTTMRVPSLDEWKEREFFLGELSGYEEYLNRKAKIFPYIKGVWGIRGLLLDEEVNQNRT